MNSPNHQNVEENIRVSAARRVVHRFIRSRRVGNNTYRAQRVRQILQRFPQLSTEYDANGKILLHRTIEAKPPLSVIRAVLLAYQAALAEGSIDDGETPFIMACRLMGESESLQQFVVMVCRQATSSRQVQPLFQGQDPRDAQKLCDLAVRTYDHYESLPIHHCCMLQSDASLRVVPLLARAYPESVVEVDGHGNAPIHYAAFGATANSLPIIRTLLRVSPRAAQVLNAAGSNVLHVLLESDSDFDPSVALPIARLLVAAHRGCASAVNFEGRTALLLACDLATADESTVTLELVQFLVNVNRAALLHRDVHGVTPLDALCSGESMSQEVPTQFIRYIVRECLQLDGGADIVTQTSRKVRRTQYHSNRVKLEIMTMLARLRRREIETFIQFCLIR